MKNSSYSSLGLDDFEPKMIGGLPDLFLFELATKISE